MAVSAQTVNFRRDVPALGPERPLEWPARERRLLGNGLEVVLVESHAIPKFHGELFFSKRERGCEHRSGGHGRDGGPHRDYAASQPPD